MHRARWLGGWINDWLSGPVADPESARGGGVSHILAEKNGC